MPARRFEIRMLWRRRWRWIVLAAMFVAIVGAVAISSPLPEKAGLYPRKPSDGLTAFSDAGSGMWGFVDIDGRTAIAPQFDAVTDFRDGLAWAAFPKLKMWCQIDTHGGRISDNSNCNPGRPDINICDYCAYVVPLPPRAMYRASLGRGKGLSFREAIGGTVDRFDLSYFVRLGRQWWDVATASKTVTDGSGATF